MPPTLAPRPGPVARLAASIRAVSAAVLDLLLPEPCCGCSGAAGPLCPACRRALPTRALWARGAGDLPGLPPVTAGGEYVGVLRAALLAHKDGATPLAQPLGVVVAAAVSVAVPGGPIRGGPVPGGSVPAGAGPRSPVVLVPVPSSRAAVRARGHDHALRLAQSAARELRRQGRRAAVLPALRQDRAVDDQGSLDAARRAVNLHGAVGVRRAGRLRTARDAGAQVVLVDDVCASGATLAECARALHRVGVPPRAAAVAATTVLRSALGDPEIPGAPSVRWSALTATPGPGRRTPCPADAEQD